MLMPKRVKWRKQMRGRMTGHETRGVEIAFGDYGLQALEPCWLTQRQIEAARRALVRYMKRRGKVWVRVFPDKPVTQRAAETRMGKGKGAVDHWVAVIKPGRILIEVSGLSEEIAREAVRLASHKLPIKTKFIISHELTMGEGGK
jgi:large subunit ribosomal protein L16